jgi:hypothetical protein
VGNIKTDLEDIGWKDMDWINLAQNREKLQVVVNMLIYL